MYIFLQFTSLNCRILLYFCLFVLLLSLWLLLLLLFCDDQLRISTDLRPEAQIQGFDTVSDCTVCVLPQITALDLQSNVLFGLLLQLFDHLLVCFVTWQSNWLLIWKESTNSLFVFKNVFSTQQLILLSSPSGLRSISLLLHRSIGMQDDLPASQTSIQKKWKI